MTLQEFKNQPWRSGMIAIYKEQEYHIAQVDFEESLVGLEVPDCEESTWVRCENIELKSTDRHPITNELLDKE